MGESGCHEDSRVWSGRASLPERAAAVRFFGEALGLEMALDEGNIVESAAGNGNKIQWFGPGHRYFDFCRGRGASIVPPLEVDDLDQPAYLTPIFTPCQESR